MKRVLHLIKGLGRGGAEQLLLTAAPHLDRERFHYEVAYLLPWKDALVGDLERADLPVHCLDGARGVGWIRRLPALVRERQVDLVHSHSPVAAVGARLSLHRTGAKRVYTEHNLWERYHRLTYWANALTFPRSHHVLAVSDHVRDSIRYPRLLRGRRLPPIETPYHGIDQSALARFSGGNGTREELGIPRKAPVVGTVANFKAHKGYPHLLRAAVEIRRAIPEVRFVLVGQGDMQGEIRELAGELGLEGSVIFAGYREDVLAVASTFDLFVLPSIHEGLSIALIEAMALGTPAVVTNVGGLPEVVEAGRQGLVIPPRDEAALTRAVVQLLGDEDMRRRMGSEARRRAGQFDIRTSVRRMEEVYEELLS